MQKQSEAHFAANYMAAAAHLLVGAPDQHAEVNDHVTIMCGPPVNMPTLLHWGAWVRENRRPIIYFNFDRETPVTPMVSVADVRNGRTSIFEGCFLWLKEGATKASLIPDDFKSGSYFIDADLNLKHSKRPPRPNFKSAEAGIVRAYSRLTEILVKMDQDGVQVPVPVPLERRAA